MSQPQTLVDKLWAAHEIVRLDSRSGRVLCRVQMALFDRSALFSFFTQLMPWEQWGDLLRRLYFVGVPEPTGPQVAGGDGGAAGRPTVVTDRILRALAREVEAHGSRLLLVSTPMMLRRFEEIASLSVRQKVPLSCVVFRVPERDAAAGYGDRVAAAFKREGRVSDAIGRTGPNEFTVFAPATDRSGVVRLVERLGRTVATRARLEHPLETGFSTAPAEPKPDPRDLLERARRALTQG